LENLFDVSGRVKNVSGQTQTTANTIRIGDGENFLKLKGEEIKSLQGVSMYPEEEFAVRAFRLGASGYLSKNQASDELVAAVQDVFSGRKHVTPALAQVLAAALFEKNLCAAHESLSPRELQVLCLIAGGNTVKQIAAELSLSEKTVGTYRTRIAKKTGMASNVELTRYAFQHGLTR